MTSIRSRLTPEPSAGGGLHLVRTGVELWRRPPGALVILNAFATHPQSTHWSDS